MSKFMQKNIDSLKQRMPQLYENLCKWLNKYEGADKTAFVSQSACGEPVMAVMRHNREWYLNSRYYAAKASEIWADSLDDFHYMSIVVLCGIANGMYLRALLKKLGNNNIVIVYEPETSVFAELIEKCDISDLIEDKRVAFFVDGINMDSFRPFFKSVFRYELINFSRILVAPGYGKIYSGKLEEFNNLCLKETNFIQGEKNTLVNLGSEMNDNEILNLWKMMCSSSIDRLKQYLNENINISELPVIIVSAGPSLDKNIEELKAAKGHALIFAVDSAIRKMMQHDIEPDMIMTVDSHKPLVLFEDERIRKIPMVMCGQSRREIYQQQNGKIFVFADDIFTWRYYAKMNHIISPLSTGGSVANSAFSLADFLGFKTIILVGQDLAFTDSRKHASDVYEEGAISEEEKDKYTYVEDMAGNPILTYTNFCIYKEWFEGEIRDNPDLNVINATEGGANIKGASNMTLKSAVEKYCKGSFDAEVLKNVPDEYSDDELENVVESFEKMLMECDRLDGKFRQGIQDYLKFKELISLNKSHTGEFRRIVQRLEEVNSADQNEPVVDLISMYSKGDEYEVLNNIYKDDSDNEEQHARNDSLAAADQGIRLLKVYRRSLRRVKERLTELLDYEVAQDVYEVTTYDISFVEK